MAQESRGALWSIGSVGLGLGLMYWLDPRSGRRRRATTRDKANHVLHETRGAADVVARDLAHRTKGLVSKASTVIHPETGVDDATLAARVRSHIGRVLSHPGAIQVNCRMGRVELKGAVLSTELKPLLACVQHVRGVREIDNDLSIRPAAAGESALQGGMQRPTVSWSLLQDNWPPAVRFVAGSFGVSAAIIALPSKGLFAKIIGATGILVALRAITNASLPRFFGLGVGRRAIDLHKTIHVHAPIEEVYGFWNAFENFPRFMSHVREVRTSSNGLSHWKVDGPGGFRLGWDAVLVVNEAQRRIAWRSVEGAIVGNQGVVRFEREDGGTRIDLRLSYAPPAGALGHAFAKLLGADPKKQLDDDLLRFKSLLEKGKATGRTETVTRDQLRRGMQQRLQ